MPLSPRKKRSDAGTMICQHCFMKLSYVGWCAGCNKVICLFCFTAGGHAVRQGLAKTPAEVCTLVKKEAPR